MVIIVFIDFHLSDIQKIGYMIYVYKFCQKENQNKEKHQNNVALE